MEAASARVARSPGRKRPLSASPLRMSARWHSATLSLAHEAICPWSRKVTGSLMEGNFLPVLLAKFFTITAISWRVTALSGRKVLSS